MIAAELDRLRARRDGVLAQNAAEDRALTRQGVEVEQNRALIRVRRYEAACSRRFHTAFKQLQPCREAATRYREITRTNPAVERVARPAPKPVPPPPVIDLSCLDAIPEPIAPLPVKPPTPTLNRHQRRALARRERLVTV